MNKTGMEIGTEDTKTDSGDTEKERDRENETQEGLTQQQQSDMVV